MTDDAEAQPRLRITYICMNTPVPAKSGYAVRIQTVAEALSRVADLRLLCLQAAEDPDSVAATRARFAADFVVAPERGTLAKGLIHTRAALANRNRWLEKFRAPKPLGEARAAIARHDAHFVVYGHLAITSLRDLISPDPSRTIVDHHNVESLNYARMRRQRRGVGKLVSAIDERALIRLERSAAAARDHWAVSDVDRDLLADILGVPVLTVPNVAPDAAFAMTPRGTQPGEPAAVGFMATYGYFPNVEAALELCTIVERLRAERVALTATALGGDAPQHLARACERAGVELPGFVPDARPILEAMTVLLAPIRSGSGTKLKIIEALAMGIPVVTTALGSEGIPIAREGIGIVVETTEELAAACRRLIEDRAEAARLGAAGRRWALANASVDALTDILRDRLDALACWEADALRG